MPATLIELFNDRYADKLVRDISGNVGEYAGDLQKGADLAARRVVDALVLRSAEPSGLRGFLDVARTYRPPMLSQGVVFDSQTDPAGYATWLDMGSALTVSLFGRAETEVIDQIAGHGGLKTSSASVILKLSMAIVWSMLREEHGDRPGHRALADYLQRQRPLPDPDFPLLKDSTYNATPMENPNRHASPEPGGVFSLRKLLPWIILILVSLALFFAVQHGCGA